MEVYLVPVGADAYELYCETPDEPEDEIEPVRPAGRWWWLNARYWFHRLKYRFHITLAEAERERRRGAAVATDGSWWQRLRRRSVRWVAESIAEQRLLWNLRRETAAEFLHPDDMPEEAAVATLRRQLTRDFEKHRLWLAIDSILLVGAAALFWLPGPNFLGYFFAFRVVGHYFSVRGARSGLDRVQWHCGASGPLTELRAALGLDPAVRLRQVEDVAVRLQLDHLATFYQRMVAS
jgi:hypothetical protein